MKDEEILQDGDLVSLRTNLEEGLWSVQRTGADREAAARLLELYAEAVREGYEKPVALRGQWWKEAHGVGGECDG